MMPEIILALERAGNILSASSNGRLNSLAWMQFQFELEKLVQPEIPDGKFGRNLALFLAMPEGAEKRAALLVQAAQDAVKVAEKFA